MKRLGLFILLASLGLTACTVSGSVSVKRIEISASETTVAPGAEVTLNAELNFETDSRVLWSTGGRDTRPDDVAFSNSGVGRTVTYTAPASSGTYTVTAETSDELSLSDTIDITVDAFLGARRVDASTDSDVTAATGALAPGEERLLVVQVSSALADANEALYLELDSSLDLTVLNEDRAVYATSSSADFFAAGTAGLDSTGLDTEAIGINKICRGSCVIRDADAGSYYLRIENSGGESVNYTLYAYVTDYSDSNEPNNDTAAGAVTLTDLDQGAIESLGDEDYYEVGVSGRLCLLGSSWSNTRVNVTGDDGLNEVIAPGESVGRLQVGDLIRVYEEGDDRAAAVGVSRYTLEMNCP